MDGFDRVRTILAAAGRVADPQDPLGREARARLRAATGLSPAGVELGMRSIESQATDAEVALLVGSVEPSPRTHVVLSANVFVAAVRALALGLASAPVVRVRPSRREPVLTELLLRAVGEAGSAGLDLERVAAISVRVGEQVHAYGRASSLASIRASLPCGSLFWPHGPGLGVAVVDESDDLEAASLELSWDVAAFDQRGCLSPRVVLFSGQLRRAREFCASLGRALDARQRDVPRGELDPAELAEASLYVQTRRMAGECWQGAAHAVGLGASGEAFALPPPGRHVHVELISSVAKALPAALCSLAPSITTIGSRLETELVRQLHELAPRARRAVLGRMQCPPFDGPVDRRSRVESV